MPQSPQRTEHINRLVYGVNTRVMEIRAARDRVLKQVRELVPLRQTHAEVMTMLTGHHPVLQLSGGNIVPLQGPVAEMPSVHQIQGPEQPGQVTGFPKCTKLVFIDGQHRTAAVELAGASYCHETDTVAIGEDGDFELSRDALVENNTLWEYVAPGPDPYLDAFLELESIMAEESEHSLG